MENKLESYRSQLQSVEIDINIKEEYIQKLESQINQYQKELTQLRQESLKLTENQTLQVGQEINLMTEQQNLRDRRNEKQLEQTISFSNLNSYAELHQQYRVEYDRMKNSISRLQHNKQNQLKQTQDEKVEIENQLAILRGNLRNNRRKLTKFNDERLELLKEEIILNEDIIQKTQQEEQHEHEHEINWLQDTIVDEFNPYCLLKQSLRALTNIDQTNLNDIRFDLNQIEHYYRGIHYSYNIDMQELKEIINSLKIEGNQLKDFELNKLFGDFIREIELITIEKVLDRLDKQIVMKNIFFLI
ncbi:unnamed protein product [Rotaria magnacalcarata]|uniref:Uncharacterized protein n=1 Tax=Rotaria magnacalcarata TaxID=392030 RepID=A0A816GCS3_9BILA|nr:unnamed protein product [Rotaria magnacalcarata]